MICIFKDGVHRCKTKQTNSPPPPPNHASLCCDRSASHSGQWQDTEADVHASRRPSEAVENSEQQLCALDSDAKCGSEPWWLNEQKLRKRDVGIYSEIEI